MGDMEEDMDTDTAQAQLMLRHMNICESLASLTATSLVSVSSMSGGQSGEVSGLGAQQDKEELMEREPGDCDQMKPRSQSHQSHQKIADQPRTQFFLPLSQPDQISAFSHILKRAQL